MVLFVSCCMLLRGVVLHDYVVFSIPCEKLHDGIKITHQSISLVHAMKKMGWLLCSTHKIFLVSLFR